MEKWEWELKKGNVWRAKEILRGHIAQTYCPSEYLAYGKLLFEVKEYYEAGKYLFAGGAAIDGEYKDAIYVFLERNRYAHLNEFLSKFPRHFAKAPYDTLPSSVTAYLRTHFPTKEYSDFQNRKDVSISQPSFFQKVKDGFSFVYTLLIMLFFLVSLFVGAYTTLKYLFEEKDIHKEYCIDMCKIEPSESLKRCIEQEHLLIERLDPAIRKLDD